MTSSYFPIISILGLSIIVQAAAAIMAIRLVGIADRQGWRCRGNLDDLHGVAECGWADICDCDNGTGERDWRLTE